ncbi:MAG: hypothetical protein K0U39_06870 [Alphaproteobacteria bacterium]|nr:hypothetical protein [Alphaproteobacteria bacterium]
MASYHHSKANISGLLITLALPFFSIIILGRFFTAYLPADILQIDDYLRHIIIFTFFQAGLSALLSIIFAVPIARMFFRQFYSHRHLIKNLCLLITVLPQIMVVFALVNLHGGSGFINVIWQFLTGTETPLYYLYGLSGILLGHIFLNLPLAVFVILHKLEEIPEQVWKNALLLNFRARDYFKYIDYPLYKKITPLLFGIIFTYCAFSFTIVLTLGGKPAYNTLEVAIYQAVKYDFDLPLAAQLGLIQMIACGLILLLTSRKDFYFQLTQASFTDSRKTSFINIRSDGENIIAKLSDYGWLLLAIMLVIVPFITMLIPANFDFTLPNQTYIAILNSFSISIFSTLLALLLSLFIISSAQYFKHYREQILLAGYVIFIVPPILLSSAIFIELPNISPLLLVSLINALMILPIMLRILAPPAFQIYDHQSRMINLLALPNLMILRDIFLPQLKFPIILAGIFGFCLSFGDISALALFGNENFVTLPFLIFSLLGSYRIDQAFTLFALMLLIYIALFRIIYHYAHS